MYVDYIYKSVRNCQILMTNGPCEYNFIKIASGEWRFELNAAQWWQIKRLHYTPSIIASKKCKTLCWWGFFLSLNRQSMGNNRLLDHPKALFALDILQSVFHEAVFLKVVLLKRVSDYMECWRHCYPKQWVKGDSRQWFNEYRINLQWIWLYWKNWIAIEKL